ncbi:MAG: family 43 glycosylhydrolase [Opitutaceae bacterium]|nr:family 43 glycosylhydrolase [Opitutaceae bacterium]
MMFARNPIFSAAIFFVLPLAAWAQPGGAAPARYPVDFSYHPAISHEPGVTRRDPSDVLKERGTFYLWYSKVTKGPGITDYPSGYSASVWYATSPDGHRWTEQGEALPKGGSGAWDERGVFTPNILRFGGKFYLYYTAVSAAHNNATPTPTHIGVAVAASPAGPWRKFTGNPVLAPSADPAQFDSLRVDDAALLVRDGKIWFYYKGRMMGKAPTETKMGVAFSDSPTGPFTKHGAPLHAGHEVMIWPQGKGVASLATAAGPRVVYFAADGLKFEPRMEVKNPPSAPGAWRRDDFAKNAGGPGLEWGIGHKNQSGDLYLVRFDCHSTSESASAQTKTTGKKDTP